MDHLADGDTINCVRFNLATASGPWITYAETFTWTDADGLQFGHGFGAVDHKVTKPVRC